MLLETKWELLVVKGFFGVGVDNYFYMALSLCSDFQSWRSQSSPEGFLLGVMFYLFEERSTFTRYPWICELEGLLDLVLMNAFYLLVPTVIWLVGQLVWNLLRNWVDVTSPLFSSYLSSIYVLVLKIDLLNLCGVVFWLIYFSASLSYSYFFQGYISISFTFFSTVTWFSWRISAKKVSKLLSSNGLIFI